MKGLLFSWNVQGGSHAEALLESALLEKGQQALIKELGPDGAMKFLQSCDALLQEGKSPNEVKPVLMEIRVDKGRRIVSLNFSRLISWLHLESIEAKNAADAILSSANSLKQ